MGKLNLKAMQEAQAREAQGYSRTEYDKLVDGNNLRRILWPKGDAESFYEEGMVHFGVGPEGKSMAVCAHNFDKKCPICDYADSLKDSDDPEDKQVYNDIKAKRRIYINVLNRDADDPNKPVVLPIGVMILRGILDIICDPDYGDITDPEEGRDITIKRSGKMLNTKYSVIAKPKTTPAAKGIDPDALEEQMADLSALFREQSYEDLEKLLNGENPSGDDDDKPKSKTVPSSKVYTSTKAPKVEDEGDDDDTYDELSTSELKELCDDRGIEYPANANRVKLITILTKADEAENDDDGGNEANDDDDNEAEAVIGNALRRRKNR